MRAFNVLGYNNPVMDKLLQDAAVEMDLGQRLPIVAGGSAWAMQKDKVTIKPRVDEDALAMNIKPQ